MYAVNIADLSRYVSEFPLMVLLRPVLDRNDSAVLCEAGRVDSQSLPLKCADDRAQAIIDIARMHYAKHKLRFYHSATGKSKNWKRI